MDFPMQPLQGTHRLRFLKYRNPFNTQLRLSLATL